MTSWRKLSRKLARPQRTKRFQRLLGGEQDSKAASSLLWAVTRAVQNGDTVSVIQRWQRALVSGRKLKTIAREIVEMAQQLAVGDSDRLRSDVETALLAVAAAQSMAAIADKCDEGQWRDALDNLVGLSVSSRADWELMPWGHQLVSVELPITLSFLLPEMDTMEQTGQQAATHLNDSLSAMLDLDGWPSADYLPVFAPLVASWTRCLRMARKAGYASDPAVDEQVHWMVPQVFRLMRNDGTLMLGGCGDAPVDDVFQSQLLKLMKGGSKGRRFAAASRLNKPSQKQLDAIDLQESSLSEWATSGVLCAGWTRRSPKLAIDFSKTNGCLEIARDRTLIAGPAWPEVRFNGQTAEAIGDFEVVCDEQSDGLDFLELEVQLSGGLRLQRQLALSRKDEFLLLSDVVLGDRAGLIEYRCDWPLAQGVEGMHESETREVYLTAGKIQSLVLPLALPEWKNGRSTDSLMFDRQKLTLSQESKGQHLYAPLFFDLNPQRSVRRRTWRQLTVAETLKIVPDDVAVAYRVQLNKQQWILYRSLADSANRTFIGENFAGEFFLGEFDKHGAVTPLLQIE